MIAIFIPSSSDYANKKTDKQPRTQRSGAMRAAPLSIATPLRPPQPRGAPSGSPLALARAKRYNHARPAGKAAWGVPPGSQRNRPSAWCGIHPRSDKRQRPHGQELSLAAWPAPSNTSPYAALRTSSGTAAAPCPPAGRPPRRGGGPPPAPHPRQRPPPPRDRPRRPRPARALAAGAAGAYRPLGVPLLLPPPALR